MSLPYDIEEVEQVFQTQGSSRARDKRLRSLQNRSLDTDRPAAPTVVSKPTVFVDASGTIVAWYLPHLYTRNRRVSGL